MQDPLGLGANPERLTWFAEAERVHSRWAMLAVAGILVQVSPQSTPGRLNPWSIESRTTGRLLLLKELGDLPAELLDYPIEMSRYIVIYT